MAAVNFFNRDAIGFYLTTTRNDGSVNAKNEHAVFNGAVNFLAKALKDAKIRSPNVLQNLTKLEDIVEAAEIEINRLCEVHSFETVGNKAYAWMVTIAVLGAYNERIERILANKKDD